MELSGSDDFGEFFHVRRLDVDDVEALILDVKVPEIDAEVVAADEGLSVAIDGDAVDVVGVGVGVRSPRDSGDNSVVVCKAGQLQRRCVPKREVRVWSWRPSTAAKGSSRGEIVGQIVLRHYFQRFLKDLPQFDRLVVC